MLVCRFVRPLLLFPITELRFTLLRCRFLDTFPAVSCHRILRLLCLEIQTKHPALGCTWFVFCNPSRSLELSKHGRHVQAGFPLFFSAGVELFSKLGENLYFQGAESSANSPPSLFVAQFQSSTLQWREAGLVVRQTTIHPTAQDAFLNVTLEIVTNDTSTGGHVSEGDGSDGVEATINVRIPGWAASDGLAASVNGDAVAVPSAGAFLWF